MDPQSQGEVLQNPSFFAKHKLSIVCAIILVLALIPLVIISHINKTAPQITTNGQNSTTQTFPTPTPAVTNQNFQSTLDNASQNIKSVINQSQTEVNTAGQIDSTSDNTIGI